MTTDTTSKEGAVRAIVGRLPTAWIIIFVLIAIIGCLIGIFVIVIPVSQAIYRGREVHITWKEGVSISTSPDVIARLERISDGINNLIIEEKNTIRPTEQELIDLQQQVALHGGDDPTRTINGIQPMERQADSRLNRERQYMSEQVQELVRLKEELMANLGI